MATGVPQGSVRSHLPESRRAADESNLITRGFHPARKRAGIRRIRFHDLRHTYASLMIRNGEDIVVVSRLLGHANASFTFNVYCHMLPRKRNPIGDRRSAIGDRLASLVFGNKMETAGDLEIQLELPEVENLSQSACAFGHIGYRVFRSHR
jgi:Phage integrase family